MAFIIQRTTANGNPLKLSNGKIAGSCCCGETSVCSTVDCGSDPSMKITVFDIDYAGGDITWCGKTWTQQEVKDGKTECVCPTKYKKGYFGTLSSDASTWNGYYSAALNRWTIPGQLYLQRAAQYQIGATTYYYVSTRSNKLTVKGVQDRELFQNSFQSGVFIPPLPVTTTTVDVSAINNIIGQPNPSIASYDFTTAFFGSHTIAGVLYKWEKGLGWP